MTGRSLIAGECRVSTRSIVPVKSATRQMRDEPQRLRFEIEARDGAARAGVLHTGHGPVETPAFIPLATKGTVRGLESAEVAELGYELILGNTYHLFVSPGPERIAAAGGLHGFMGWERALITDSGGFQVFSLAHGGVADEVKGSGRPGGEHGSVLSIDEEGVRFRSYRDGTELFISPEVSMQRAGGARQRHRPRLRRVHALPRRPRLHGALDGAHPPLARSLPRVARARGPRRARRSSRSSRAASTRTCAASRPRSSPRPPSTGSRSAAPSAATRRRWPRCWR